MTLECLLLPEPALRQLIEACRAVGLEPELFEGDDRACDADILADFISENWLPEPSALHTLETLDHALHELRKTLRSRLSADHLSLELELEKRPELGGEWRMSTARLRAAYNDRLLKLAREQADSLEISTAFDGLSTAARLNWPGSSARLAERILEWFPESGLPGCPRPLNRLGARQESCEIFFCLPTDIAAYSYGVPALAEAVEEISTDPAVHAAELGPSPLFEWQKLSDILGQAFKSARSAQRRLAWLSVTRMSNT